jgi:hypothetical protein
VQADPINIMFKPPGTKCLKLRCDILLSTSAFKFNLYRYAKGRDAAAATPGGARQTGSRTGCDATAAAAAAAAAT